MRPPNNKRARGRTNRRSPNPNRSYDSNGPEGKIRGNASQVYEKYSQLARDSSASGDPITAEGYWQHAEHYYRIMMALQQNRPQQQPNQNPNQQNAQGQDDGDSGNGGADNEVQAVDPAQQDQPDVQSNAPQPVIAEESDTAGLERVVRPKRARRPRRPREESNDDAPQKSESAEPAAPEVIEGAAD